MTMEQIEIGKIQHQREVLSGLTEMFSIENEGDFETSLLLTNSAQQIETRRFFLERSRQFFNPVLVTLTFRNVPSKDEDIASRYEFFLNRLSKRCFKHAYHRYGKMVERPLAIWEKDADTRPHIHATFECPAHINPRDFELHIKSLWRSGTVDFRQSFIHPVRGLDDWVDYLCKFRSKDTLNRQFLENVLF